jgi:membrane protease subunit HflC
MNNKILGIGMVVGVSLLLILSTVAFTLESYQVAIVKTFGKAASPMTEAGLHFKLPWPIQSVTRYDRRTFIFDDTHEQIQTADHKNITVTVYCCWRIQDALTFVRNAPGGSIKEAERSLRDIVRDAKKNVLGQHAMTELVNTDPEKMKILDIENTIRDQVQQSAAIYGVAVTDVGVKSIGLPESVTKTVIENMKSERNRLAERYKAQGESDAKAIRGQADSLRSQIAQFAENYASLIRSEGDAAAAQFYSKFEKNQQFAMFLRELDFLKDVLKNNTVIVLDKSMQHSFSLFGEGANLPGKAVPSTQPASQAAANAGQPSEGK